METSLNIHAVQGENVLRKLHPQSKFHYGRNESFESVSSTLLASCLQDQSHLQVITPQCFKKKFHSKFKSQIFSEKCWGFRLEGEFQTNRNAFSPTVDLLLIPKQSQSECAVSCILQVTYPRRGQVEYGIISENPQTSLRSSKSTR